MINYRGKKRATRTPVIDKYADERVAWRIVKDWVEAQMALIESGLAELPEVFLPYAVKPDGRTVYDEFKGNLLMLSEGDK